MKYVPTDDAEADLRGIIRRRRKSAPALIVAIFNERMDLMVRLRERLNG